MNSTRCMKRRRTKIQKILDNIKENAKTVGIESTTKILMIPRTDGIVKPILKMLRTKKLT